MKKMGAEVVTLILICCFLAILSLVLALTCSRRKKQQLIIGSRLGRPAVRNGQGYDVEAINSNVGDKDGDMVILGGAAAIFASTAVLASIGDDASASAGCGGGNADGGCGGGGF